MEIGPIWRALTRNKTGAILIALQIAVTMAIMVNAISIMQERSRVMARPSGVDEQNIFYISSIGFAEDFNELAENSPIVPKQTSFARVVSGEIPILFDYDFNAYRGKYEEDGNFEFVLPCEGSVRVPYVMSLVNNGPNPELGKRVLDFILSDKGQAIWTNAYLQPSRPVELPAEVAAKFLPASDYERAVAVDYAKMEKAQAGFGERYLSEVE